MRTKWPELPDGEVVFWAGFLLAFLGAVLIDPRRAMVGAGLVLMLVVLMGDWANRR